MTLYLGSGHILWVMFGVRISWQSWFKFMGSGRFIWTSC